MSNQGKQSPLSVNVTSALLQSSGLKINGNVTTFVGSSTGVSNYTKGSIATETVLGTISDVLRLAFPKIGTTVTQATYDNLLAMGSSIPALANRKPSTYSPAYTAETTSFGFLRMLALQANNEFKFNNGTYSDFVASFSMANGYKSMLNKQINTLVNGKSFLDGIYSNMDDLISGDITGVNLSTVYWGQDLIATGRCINLAKIDKFGTPSVLLLSMRNSNALTKRVNEELVNAGINISEILQILSGTYTPTINQELQIYNAFTQIVDADLKDVLIPLNVQTKNITTLADLLNPRKLFPKSYISLTVAKYNTTGSPTNSKIYYLIYANNGLNPQLRAMNFGDRLFGMIPDQIAIPCDAFSNAMMQIKNIKTMNIEKFSQVVANLEIATANLNLTQVNGTGGTPADKAAMTSALTTIARGSGTNGTYRTIDFFGSMSGLSYDFKKIGDSIKSLQSTSLTNTANSMKTLLSSAPVSPATTYDTALATLITSANNEITAIYNSKTAEANNLNTLWSAMGTQLSIEVTARATALTTGATTGLNEIMSFVDSISGIATETDLYQSAQVLESICDLSTKGGTNIIALMRETRNAKRLGLTGGELDNDIPDSPIIPIGISNTATAAITSGPLVGLSKITGASDIPGSFGGSPETKLIPANLDIFNISPTTLTAIISPPQAVAQVIACNCDCWDELLG
jgi:hypothetical protein